MKKLFLITWIFSCGLLHSQNIQVGLKVFLEGPFVNNEMIPLLNAMGHLPATQPYDQWPWFYYGSENVTSIPNVNVIDWVLIELRIMKNTTKNSEMDSLLSRQAGKTNINSLVTDNL